MPPTLYHALSIQARNALLIFPFLPRPKPSKSPLELLELLEPLGPAAEEPEVHVPSAAVETTSQRMYGK